MLRETSLRLAGADALLFAAAATPALAAGDPPTQASGAPSAQASETGAAPVEAAKPQQKPEDRKICRSINGSDSRLNRQRVCLTAEQWSHTEY